MKFLTYFPIETQRQNFAKKGFPVLGFMVIKWDEAEQRPSVDIYIVLSKDQDETTFHLCCGLEMISDVLSSPKCLLFSDQGPQMNGNGQPTYVTIS